MKSSQLERSEDRHGSGLLRVNVHIMDTIEEFEFAR